jgi:hypothetical protein
MAALIESTRYKIVQAWLNPHLEHAAARRESNPFSERSGTF